MIIALLFVIVIINYTNRDAPARLTFIVTTAAARPTGAAFFAVTLAAVHVELRRGQI